MDLNQAPGRDGAFAGVEALLFTWPTSDIFFSCQAWQDDEGTVVVVKDSRMYGPDGGQLDLKITSRDECSFQMGHLTASWCFGYGEAFFQR